MAELKNILDNGGFIKLDKIYLPEGTVVDGVAAEVIYSVGGMRVVLLPQSPKEYIKYKRSAGMGSGVE